MHDARTAREPAGQLVQSRARLGHVVEAEGGEARFRRGLGQGSDAGQRVQDRGEEELLVDRTDACPPALMLGLERLERGDVQVVAEAEHPREVRARCRGVGDRMGLMFVDEL